MTQHSIGYTPMLGKGAYTIVWTYTNPTYWVRKSTLAVKDTLLIILQLKAKFQNYLPVVQKMLISFEVMNSTNGLKHQLLPIS
jgi:hypothetical protein